MLMQKLDNQDNIRQLFLLMVNYGNYIEIEAELNRQQEQVNTMQSYQIWQKLANCIIEIQKSQFLKFKRIYIQRFPFENVNESQQEAIDQVKQKVVEQSQIDGVSIDDLSWDAISYKVYPSASEIFCTLNPTMINNLSQASIAIIDTVQDDLLRIIKQKLVEQRSTLIQNQIEDDFVPDISVFLESIIAAKQDDQRSSRIQSIGDNTLIKYIAAMQPLFQAGFIPGAIAPAKIFSCQDMVSAAEIRATIQRMAEASVVQKTQVMDNPNVRHHMKVLADESVDMRTSWSKEQTASINQGKFINQSLAQGLRSFGETPFQPQKDLAQQLSGGSNDLKDEFNVNFQGAVVDLSPADKVQMTMNLSMLMSCLRIRFDATQYTKTELATDEDMDHLEICKRLSSLCDPESGRLISQHCTVLEEAIINGHNKVKMKGFGVGDELNWAVKDQIEVIAREMLQAIPFLQTDHHNSSPLYQQVMNCLYIGMAQKQRIDMEIRSRTSRKKLIVDSINKY